MVVFFPFSFPAADDIDANPRQARVACPPTCQTWENRIKKKRERDREIESLNMFVQNCVGLCPSEKDFASLCISVFVSRCAAGLCVPVLVSRLARQRVLALVSACLCRSLSVSHFVFVWLVCVFLWECVYVCLNPTSPLDLRCF